MPDTTPPSPAGGEPEMPEAAGWTKHEDICGDAVGPSTPVYTAEQLRAYGDARAEHARRKAMEAMRPLLDLMPRAVEVVDEAANWSPNEEHQNFSGFSQELSAAIRAAAQPQGERTS